MEITDCGVLWIRRDK